MHYIKRNSSVLPQITIWHFVIDLPKEKRNQYQDYFVDNDKK